MNMDSPEIERLAIDKTAEGAVYDICAERVRQDLKWGEQNHDPDRWMSILMEEVGEFAQASLQARFGKGSPAAVREELVQVAAVALSMIECCDRNGWHT